MRHFIVSDLHGNGYVYDSIINYLQNELDYGNDDITLHINGDLIDRGLDSGSMLLDVYEKINGGNTFHINYLGGNHELMMYQSYKETCEFDKKDMFSPWVSRKSHNWVNRNGGDTTSTYLLNNCSKEFINDICEFIGNLSIYQKFNEQLKDKPIILTHACVVKSMENDALLKIKDDSPTIDVSLWTRKEDSIVSKFFIGSKKYFTIIGHTPTYNKKGYVYDSECEVLNIDGGNSVFDYEYNNYLYKIKNMFQQIEDVKVDINEIDEETNKILLDNSHTPLVEINDNNLKILTFNFKNEIIRGNYFDGEKSSPIDSLELDKIRNNLKQNDNVKKRILKRM